MPESAPLVSSRPEILVDGQRETALENALMSLSARLTEGWAADLEIEFGNWGTDGDSPTGFMLFSDKLDFGKSIEVKTSEGTLFAGRIFALEARYARAVPPTLAVRADDALQDLRMTRRTRGFCQVSDADIVRTIASDHGLESDVDLSGGTAPQIAQANQTDLAFLRSRVRAAGADLWLEGRKLCAKRMVGRTDCGLELARGANLFDFQVCADLAHQRTSLVVGGWDVEAKQAIAESIDKSCLGDLVESGGRSGPEILAGLQNRVETIVHRGQWDSTLANDEGKGLFGQMANRFVQGRGRTVADPRLCPGRKVRLSGLGPWFSGLYGIREAHHRFDAAQGLWTDLEVERAWIGGSL